MGGHLSRQPDRFFLPFAIVAAAELEHSSATVSANRAGALGCAVKFSSPAAAT